MIKEFDLIDWIRKKPQTLPPSVLRGIGDDCAVFDPSFAKRLVVTSDALVEEVHFKSRWSAPRMIGRKALAVNLSDVAAMGAFPFACLLNLTLPSDRSLDWVETLLEGFLEECCRWNCPLIGGNLSSGPCVHLSVTAWGSLEEGEAVGRDNAKAGDALFLCGPTGFSKVGLEILRAEDPDLSQLSDEPQLKAWAGDDFRFECLRAHLLPTPLLPVGVWLQRNRMAGAMIDVSDGLAADLSHLLEASGVRALLTVDEWPPLPGAEDREFDSRLSVDDVLQGGEDYSLLFTVPQSRLEAFGDCYPASLPPCTMLGRLEDGGPSIIVATGGKRRRYRHGGFRHFR